MRLECSGQNEQGSKKELAEDIVFGSLLGAGFFSCICSAFGLRWTPSSMFSGSPMKGLLSVANAIADRMGERDYIILDRFAGGVLPGGGPAEHGIFLTFLLIALMIIGFMIVRSRVRAMLLILILPMASLMMLTRTAPGIWAGLGTAFVILCAAAAMKEKDNRIWIAVLPLMALIATAAIGIGFDDSNEIPAGEPHIDLMESLQGWTDKRFGEDPLKSGQLMELDGDKLSKTRGSMKDPNQALGRKDLSRTALEVRMKDPQPTYLRGFVGEIYKSGRWEQLDNATHYGQRENLYWLNREGFDGLSQLANASSAAGGGSGAAGYDSTEAEGAGTEQTETNEIEIKVKGADSSRIYTPYEVSGTDNVLPAGTRNYSGGFLKSDRLFGTGSYTWKLMPNLTDRWTDLAGQLYSSKETDELIRYFENESRYNVWCYQQYTEIPAGMRGMLEAAVGDPGDLSRHHADYKKTIEIVRSYLDGNFVYTEGFSKPKEGGDAVEDFLVTGKGCDAHYASLASLLFRWYGIPARYVEGYLVTPADTEDAKATQNISIGASHAHAWTEIYVDGLGWVPLEVTSAYRGVMPEADLDVGLEAVSYESRQIQQEEAKEDVENLNEAVSGSGRRLLRIMMIGLWILLMLLSAWLLRNVVRRYLIRRRRQKAFADPDPRTGICAMYGYLLREKIPCSPLATEIGDLAAFSNNEVDERLRTYMRREMEWGENEKKLLEDNDRRNVADRVFDLWNSLRRK